MSIRTNLEFKALISLYDEFYFLSVFGLGFVGRGKERKEDMRSKEKEEDSKGSPLGLERKWDPNRGKAGISDHGSYGG